MPWLARRAFARCGKTINYREVHSRNISAADWVAPSPYGGMGVRRPNPIDTLAIGLLAFAVFTMSMHILRPGPVNVTVSDAAIAVCAITLMVRSRINSTPFGQSTFFWCCGLTLMLGGLLVSSIANGDPMRWNIIAIQYSFAWLLLPMVFFSLSAVQMRRCMLWFVYGVAASQAFALALSTLLPFGTLKSLFGPGFLSGNGRLGALTGESNWNGAVIAFALPMLISCLHHKLIGRIGATICTVFLVWGLIACASFTGFASALLAVMITLGLSNPVRLFKIGLPLAGLVSGYLLSGLPLPAVFQQRVAGALTTGDLSSAGTFEGRAMLISEAWKLSEQTIFLGFGADRYREVSEFGAPVHQFLLLILTEGGAFALAGLLVMLSILWIIALKSFRIDRQGAATAVAVLSVFCIFTTAVPHMYTRLWIGPVLMALAAVAREQKRWAVALPSRNPGRENWL
jgi:hypothetical protein